MKRLFSLKATDTVPPDNGHENEAVEWACDDLTGCELDGREVKKARMKELEYIQDKNVWKVITRAEAKRNGWKIIRTRWIDINKGDSSNPDLRSRLVAKEFNTGEEDGLFAATPPLEALRMLVSDAATVGNGEKVIMINDVARAFFEAPMKRMVCVELPAEVKETAGEDAVGLLQMSLYGTRDAAVNFQEEVARFMAGIGFARGRYNPCTYYHSRRRLKTMVHGDDFVTSGERGEAKWFLEKLKGRFEIKTKIIGRGVDEAQEGRVLNRILRAAPKDGSMNRTRGMRM